MKTDERLQRDVLDQLDWEPSIDASQIGVTVRDGIATLTGQVPTHTDKHTAEKQAKRVHGVKAVVDELEVRPSGTHEREDEQIASAAIHALQWNSKVPDDLIQVVVHHGRIELDGTVPHRFERAAAERAVRHLRGVRAVKNNIMIGLIDRDTGDWKSASQIKDDIENALRRSANVNSQQVSVEVLEHKVVLTGDVRSPAEHDEVERIAWTNREVADVDNCITITPWGCGPMEEWGY
ncbi:MAG: BON domain-containing protein [Planctomycetales bacterium]|nr:BON domain-containing protein [Planctomycetales bacterium]